MVAINSDVFDVLPGASSAVVTPLAGAPVTTIVQWEQEDASPAEMQGGTGAASAVNRRVVAYVRRDQVATLSPGATINGGPAHQSKAVARACTSIARSRLP